MYIHPCLWFQLDEIKARERSLKVRVKSLTNELAQFRRFDVNSIYLFRLFIIAFHYFVN